MKRKILIAAALPYANGSLHFGHVAGLIGSDVLARYFRLNGNSVLYVSGSDCYGTPIVFEAEKNNIHPSEIADKYHKEFTETLITGLNFSYDFFTKTTSSTHTKTVQEIFLNLYEKGLIYKKTEELPYCENCKKFLPDRYIEGECYLCHFDSARGDQCDGCGSLMETKRIINPTCKICKHSPVWKDSEHFFLKLSHFEKELKNWVKNSNGWRLNAKNFTLQFLNEGLHDRSITRDTNWGVPIPIEGYEDKKIYVWFEAVCGYLSASKEWSETNWEDFWKNENALHYYVHGKDNIPFHSIIWPAILLGNGNLHLPDRIISSEYLTLEKKQFSKSRNWAIWVKDFLNDFDSETLRYYLVINGSENSDSDFSWEEFYAKTNNELIANFGNFVYRTISFIEKNFKESFDFPEIKDNDSLKFLSLAEKTFSETATEIESAHFRKALQSIFKLVDYGNRYIDKAEPWKTIKENPKKAKDDLAVLFHVIRCLAVLINPFLPKTSERLCSQINKEYSTLKWEYPSFEKIIVNEVKPLFEKIERETIDKEIDSLKKSV
jgi:methionyl-tRNA synthetase